MASFYDDISTYFYGAQNGIYQISLPLIDQQEYFCRVYTQQLQRIAYLYSPIVGDRFSYDNLLTWSDDITQVSWEIVNGVPTSNAFTDPEGGTTASFFSESSDDGPHSVIQDPGLSAGPVYACVHIRPRQRSFCQIRFSNGSENPATCIIDFNQHGIVSQSASNGVLGATMIELANGWFQVSLSGVASVSGTVLAIDVMQDLNTFSYPGTPGTGLFIWRCSLSQANMPPAIKTEAEARTINSPAFLILKPHGDYLAYVVNESPPEDDLLKLGIAQWTRTYARVARTTSVPSSIIVSKPSVSGTGPYILANGAFFNQIDPNTEAYDVYTETEITMDSGVPDFSVTGGTYTLTYGTETTSDLAFDADATAVHDALVNLAGVSNAGGCSVTGSATSGFEVTLSPSPIDQLTVDVSSLTASGTSPVILARIQSYATSVAVGNVYQVWQIRAYSLNGSGDIRILTGGTYTLTLFGQTTADIPYDANSQAIEDALNALPGVSAYGGVTMYQTQFGDSGFVFSGGLIYFAFSLNLKLISGDSSNLLPINSSIQVTADPSQYNRVQTIKIDAGASRQVYAANHGIGIGGQLFVEASVLVSPSTIYSTTYYVPITNYGVIDQNNVALFGTEADGYMVAATLTRIGRGVLANYQPGPKNCKCTKQTSYYLPGVTLGIDSVADIPIPPSQSDSYSFFQGLFTGDALAYVVGEVGVWKGPILFQTTTYVDPFDIGDFISPVIRITIDGGGNGTVYSDPAGINTTGDQTGSFVAGTAVTLTAVPDSGSAFVKWSGDIGSNSSIANPIVVTAQGSLDISAIFVITG